MSRRGNRPHQGTKNRGCGATPSPSPSKPPVAPPTETRGRKTRPPTRSPTGRPTGAPTASIATAPPTRRPSAAPSAKPSAAPSPRARLITPAPTRKPTQAPVRPTPPPTTRPTPTPTYAPSRSPSAAPTTPLSRSGGQRCCEDARDPTGNPYGTLTGTVTPQDITAFDPFIVNITYAESGITMSTSAGCGGSNSDSASYLVIKEGRLCWTQGIDYGVSASPGPCRNNTIYSLVEGVNFWQLVGVDESNFVMLGQLDLTCLSTC
ncbi:hypothetical protein MPSEU_000778300 [Mayamaea pseudoterrestris]|nr:hypothetical protein MPSEU_000778300 [Mayamaea pseudoterrestris]